MLGERANDADLAVLGEVTVPTLVVVDYAEARTDALDPLIAALDRAQEKVRLLLLARTAGAWRTDRVSPATHLERLGEDAIVVNLSPVEPAPEGRREAWAQAVAALAPRLAGLDGLRHIPWATLTADLSPTPAR